MRLVLDAGEKHLGPVEKFTADEYKPYVKIMAEENGFRYQPTNRDKTTFRWLISQYGQKDAGRIVKHMFHRYKGRYEGETFSHAWFCAKRKWWTDMILAEVHLAQKSEPTVKNEVSLAWENANPVQVSR